MAHCTARAHRRQCARADACIAARDGAIRRRALPARGAAATLEASSTVLLFHP
jgi:hypothetical protein